MRTMAAISSGSPRRPIGGGAPVRRPFRRTRQPALALDRARHHAVDRDLVRREVERERFRQAREARLRRDDVRALGSALVRSLAPDVHDRSAARLDEVRQRRLRAKERAVEHDRQHFASTS